MAGNPRDHVKGKVFWDGGGAGRSTNKESAGRPSGLPGSRKPNRTGVATDIEFPNDESKKSDPARST